MRKTIDERRREESVSGATQYRAGGQCGFLPPQYLSSSRMQMWFLYGSFVLLSDSPRERQLQLLHSLRENDTHGQRRVINKEIGGDEGGKEEVKMYLWKSFKWNWIIDCEGSSAPALTRNF